MRPIAGPACDALACGTEAARLEDALASRPDVRAAEIGIEAAAQRARWERSRVLTLIGILDGNGSGAEGARGGPGVNLDVPIFSRNQGGIGRADAEIERAGRQYAAVRAQVIADVRSATRQGRGRPSRRSAPGGTRSCRRSRSNSVRPRAPIRPARFRSSRCSTSAAGSSTAAPGCSTPRRICRRRRSRSNGASAVRALSAEDRHASFLLRRRSSCSSTAGCSGADRRAPPRGAGHGRTSSHRSGALHDHADGRSGEAARHRDGRRQDRCGRSDAHAGRRGRRARRARRRRDRAGGGHADGRRAARGRARACAAASD